VVGTDIEIEKIDYLPVPQTINEISHCAAEDQGYSEDDGPVPIAQPPKPIQEQDERARGRGYQKGKKEGSRGAIHESEGKATIPHVDQIEKPVQDRDRTMNRDGGLNEVLADLIQDDHG